MYITCNWSGFVLVRWLYPLIKIIIIIHNSTRCIDLTHTDTSTYCIHVYNSCNEWRYVHTHVSIGSLSTLITSPTAHVMHTHQFHITRPDVTLTKDRHVTTCTHRGRMTSLKIATATRHVQFTIIHKNKDTTRSIYKVWTHTHTHSWIIMYSSTTVTGHSLIIHLWVDQKEQVSITEYTILPQKCTILWTICMHATVCVCVVI